MKYEDYISKNIRPGDIALIRVPNRSGIGDPTKDVIRVGFVSPLRQSINTRYVPDISKDLDVALELSPLSSQESSSGLVNISGIHEPVRFYLRDIKFACLWISREQYA